MRILIAACIAGIAAMLGYHAGFYAGQLQCGQHTPPASISPIRNQLLRNASTDRAAF